MAKHGASTIKGLMMVRKSQEPDDGIKTVQHKGKQHEADDQS